MYSSFLSMKKQSLFLVLILGSCFYTTNLHAAEGAQEDVLFSIGDTEITLDEFSRVYQRNNPNSDIHTDQKDVEDYLDLYINFRLKVKEAKNEGIDTISHINDELEGYRKQLARSFIFDKDVTESLIKEAYERMKEEVRVSHVLISLPENALPADTLEAYRKIMNIRRRAVRGEDFAKLAVENSQDPSVSQNKGDIGYLTAFRTVYPFETAAYNTAEGEVSMPVRTRFGYHIIKVHERRQARGEMVAAHILISAEGEDEEKLKEAEMKINHIKSLLDEGGDFRRLAMKHSDDQFSSRRGGELPPFSTGRMVPEFEQAAYALENDGDISDPVKTPFGYHIIKRIHVHPLPTLEAIRSDLRNRVERDTRSDIAKKELIERIKSENNFRFWRANYEELEKLVDENLLTGAWTVQDAGKYTKPLFRIGDTTYQQKDFIYHVENQRIRRRSGDPKDIFKQLYNQFQDDKIIEFEEFLLEEKNPNFKALMNEYRNGILLFELTDRKIWSQALQDTTGLKTFHEKNKDRFMWDERADVNIYTIKDDRTARRVKRWANRGRLSKDEMLSRVNDDENPDKLKIENKLVERGGHNLIDMYEWETGITENINNPDGSVTFLQFNEIRKPEPKKLKEARGFIVSAYQEHLEKEWVKELRAKYPVNINHTVLESLWK